MYSSFTQFIMTRSLPSSTLPSHHSLNLPSPPDLHQNLWELRLHVKGCGVRTGTRCWGLPLEVERGSDWAPWIPLAWGHGRVIIYSVRLTPCLFAIWESLLCKRSYWMTNCIWRMPGSCIRLWFSASTCIEACAGNVKTLPLWFFKCVIPKSSDLTSGPSGTSLRFFSSVLWGIYCS